MLSQLHEKFFPVTLTNHPGRETIAWLFPKERHPLSLEPPNSVRKMHTIASTSTVRSFKCSPTHAELLTVRGCCMSGNTQRIPNYEDCRHCLQLPRYKCRAVMLSQAPGEEYRCLLRNMGDNEAPEGLECTQTCLVLKSCQPHSSNNFLAVINALKCCSAQCECYTFLIWVPPPR